MAESTIGFVGTGRMGGPMAGRLLDAGYSLSVYDTQIEATAPLVARGARLARSPAEVASSADIVFVSLPTPDIVKAVALGPDGIIAGNRVSILIDLSTSGPGAAKLIAEGFEAPEHHPGGCTRQRRHQRRGEWHARGHGFLPPNNLRDGAADPEDLRKAVLLRRQAGHGADREACQQSDGGGGSRITSEAVAMGVKGGVNARVLIDIINASSGRNSASEDKFPRAVLPGTFDFGFTTGLSYKDVRLCVDEAEAMGVPMVCGSAVRQMLAITNAKYGARPIHVDREGSRGMGRRGNARLGHGGTERRASIDG